MEEHKQKASQLLEQHKEQVQKRELEVPTPGRYQRYNPLG